MISESPRRLGAKECPNCHDSELSMTVKNLNKSTYFVEIMCNRCFREGISEVNGRLAGAILGAISRWNSKWPDVKEYITGDTEGIHYHVYR